MPDRGIFPDSLAERLKARSAEKYRPSNGTEGEIFTGMWCDHCTKRDGGCLIEIRAFCLGLDHPDYPPEWQYGENGQPTCTAFDDERLPPEPRPVKPCPGQLSLF